MSWSVSDKKGGRERFASPFAILGLIGTGLLLLFLLYPEKSLLKLLSESATGTPARQRYLEALQLVRQDDPQLLIQLLQGYLASGCTEKGEQLLNRFNAASLSKGEQGRIDRLRYELLRQQLEWYLPAEKGRDEKGKQYAMQVRTLSRDGATATELGRYLADAASLGEQQTAAMITGLLEEKQGVDSSEMAATLAIGRGDYRKGAELYFAGMAGATEAEQRRLFLAGLQTLQSGNLLAEAMVAAERHFPKGLKGDRQLLKQLTRLALAANRPDRAAVYIGQALGVSSDAGRPEGGG